MLTDQADLDGLRKSITGEIIVPDDVAYDEARTIFYGMSTRPSAPSFA